MRYYLDTEFDENGYDRINLISIGLRCEDGREYYAVAGDGWDPKQCNPWVRDNVLPFLRIDGQKIPDVGSIINGRIFSHVDGGDEECQTELRMNGIPIRSRDQIRDDLITFFVRSSDGSLPQIWGYFADYDWVLFCQLFGRMIDLPKFLPMYCLDLKQEMTRLGIDRNELPRQDSVEHNALGDARFLERMHGWINIIEQKQTAARLEGPPW